MKTRFLDDMSMPAPRRAKKKPAPPMSDDMAEDDDEALEGEELADELFGGADEEADEMAGPLADVSDDDLLAEARRRGLPVSEPDDTEEDEEEDLADDDMADDEDMV